MPRGGTQDFDYSYGYTSDLPSFYDHPVDCSVQFFTKFYTNSVELVRKCTKPDLQEFNKLAIATSIGFLAMGFLGFFVRLIHIPINNILRGA